ncbi:hypothetical protein BT63DRAFT_456247 [Microthyrium microscopicum]|uniref:Uncharacterized protein n=1 Tax=Microthyrium microscopicum TaxID=703497 RepID=A0A6A6U8K2_9PEZI|nr:hypothetical protein BT63DRAFT_456247 [Microthyrium microscopicum]
MSEESPNRGLHPDDPLAKQLTARTQPTVMKTEPMEKPIRSLLSISIPQDRISAILQGSAPESMAQKWYIYSTGPTIQGLATLFMFRSWTGLAVAEITISIPVDGAGKTMDGDSKMTEIRWESSYDRVGQQTEESAKETVLEVCKWVLGVDLS